MAAGLSESSFYNADISDVNQYATAIEEADNRYALRRISRAVNRDLNQIKAARYPTPYKAKTDSARAVIGAYDYLNDAIDYKDVYGRNPYIFKEIRFRELTDKARMNARSAPNLVRTQVKE
jgi:hypothetical protein